MATDALVVKGPLQFDLRLRSMTRRTANTLFSFRERTFIEDVFPVFIQMVAVLAGDACFGMTIMGKAHRRTSSFSRDLRIVQHDVFRLRREMRRPDENPDSHYRDHQGLTAYR